MRKPSDKTQLTAARREIRELTTRLSTASRELTAYRGRATKAEQELAEWKTRFDRLLKLAVEPAEVSVTGGDYKADAEMQRAAFAVVSEMIACDEASEPGERA